MWLRFDVEVDQHGYMIFSFQELHETGGVDRSGLGVIQRMKVQGFVFQDLSIDGDSNGTLLVVDHTERCNGAGNDAEVFHQAFGAPERKSARPQPFTEVFEVDGPIFETHEQPHDAFLVSKKEVFRVAPDDLSSQRLGLFNGEHRRVVNRVEVQAEILQPAEQSFRGCGGRAVYQAILFVIHVLMS